MLIVSWLLSLSSIFVSILPQLVGGTTSHDIWAALTRYLIALNEDHLMQSNLNYKSYKRVVSYEELFEQNEDHYGLVASIGEILSTRDQVHTSTSGLGHDYEYHANYI